MSSAAKRAAVAGELHKIVKPYGVIDGKNRKIYKSYAVIDGINRLIYMSENFAFTGAYAVSLVEIDGTKYDLYKLTTSGMLSIYADNALFWMCGGGAGGVSATMAYSGAGGGGAFCTSGELPSGRYPVEIGKGGAADTDGTATTLGTYTAAGGKTGAQTTGGSGGTGGGGGDSSSGDSARYGVGGTGDGVSKYPFGLTSLFAHCAGGGGGTNYYSQAAYIRGGEGGTNGSDGKDGNNPGTHLMYALGGEKGGGNGGQSGGRGSDATFYGSAGGGGGKATTSAYGKGGSGYQGVVYVAIVHKQEPLIITRQPENITATSGSTFTFAVEATGVAEYQWQYGSDGSEFYDLPANDKWVSAKTNTLKVAVDEYSIAWYYRCKLTGLDGSVKYTNVAKFTSPIIITKQPENAIGSIGDTVTFSLEAFGNISMYRWQRSTNGGATWSAVYWGNSGFDTGTFTFTVSDEGRLNGLYRCIVYCADGDAYNVTSDVVSITPA